MSTLGLGMRIHHTKNKGDLGVLKAQADLAEQGYMVLLPLTEHHAFDLVIYKDGQFKRVQVKYRSAYRGRLEIHFRSTWSDQHGMHVVDVNKAEIDLYCVYCPDTNECYYFDPAQFNRSISLRVDMPKNSQASGIHFATDYRRVP
ncbi:MAG: hypothetical protein KDE58_34610 [Caldilineaceae bacterium]|nr:hypothetical protein [Caldilineaceae bacterium]